MVVLAQIVLRLLADLAGLVLLSLRSRRSVEAEDLFLRRQLALLQERADYRKLAPRVVRSEVGRLIQVIAAA